MTNQCQLDLNLLSPSEREVYDSGYSHGWDSGVSCCFGGSKKPWPVFSDDEAHLYDIYQSGFDDGEMDVETLDRMS